MKEEGVGRIKKNLTKGTVNAGDPPCEESSARFTTVPLNALIKFMVSSQK